MHVHACKQFHFHFLTDFGPLFYICMSTSFCYGMQVTECMRIGLMSRSINFIEKIDH